MPRVRARASASIASGGIRKGLQHREFVAHLAENLDSLDRIDPQVGFHVQVEPQCLDRDSRVRSRTVSSKRAVMAARSRLRRRGHEGRRLVRFRHWTRHAVLDRARRDVESENSMIVVPCSFGGLSLGRQGALRWCRRSGLRMVRARSRNSGLKEGAGGGVEAPRPVKYASIVARWTSRNACIVC